MRQPPVTKAQRALLETAGRHDGGRISTDMANQRTIERALARGLIEVEANYYGPLYRITAAGRKVISR